MNADVFRPSVMVLEDRTLLSTGTLFEDGILGSRLIPDNGGDDNRAVWELDLSGAPSGAVITSVDIEYWIEHTWVGDLKVWATTQRGSTWYDYTLWNREGGSSDDIHEDEEGINAWNGLSPNGSWYLVAADYAPQDEGKIDAWKIWVHWRTPEVTELTWRSGTSSSSSTVGSKEAGQTVYLRADAFGMNGETITVNIYEDDGLQGFHSFDGDDFVTSKTITIGSSGYGTASWTADWQDDGVGGPEYFIYYSTDDLSSPDMSVTDQTAPSTPSLQSPSNGTVITTSDVDFNWSNSSDNSYGSGFDHYELWVDDTSSFNTSPIKRTTTSSSYDNLSLAEGRWYWKVRAYDNEGNYAETGYREFERQDPHVSALSFRNGTSSSSSEISSIEAGNTVYLRADAIGMNGQTIDVELWEDDGIGDDLIATKSITINSQGYGTVAWAATWQGDDQDDPFNRYYLGYNCGLFNCDVYSSQPNAGHFLVRPPQSNVISGRAYFDPTILPLPFVASVSAILDRIDNSSDIDPNLRTWVVVHGRDSSFEPGRMLDLTRAVDRATGSDQVITLDWREGAEALTPLDFLGERWIRPIAKWAASVLATYGFPGSLLNVVGHSWGAVLSAELADHVPTGVNGVVAIDPAEDVPYLAPVVEGTSYNTDDISFSEDSTFSWALYTPGIAGNEETPTTADLAFVVRDSEHSKLVELFTDMIENPAGGVSQYFDLSRLLNANPGPWHLNQYNHDGTPGGEYEAVMQSMGVGTLPGSITYIDKIIGTSVTVFEPLLSIDDVSMTEDDIGTKDFTFTVSLSEASSQDVTMQYTTATGRATASSDYVATSGTLTISAGQTSRTISISVNGDTTVEPDETFYVNLSNANGATITNSQGSGTILNDDAATLTLAGVSAYQNEGTSGTTTDFTFSVTLDNAVQGGLNVAYTTDDDTATVADSDYVDNDGSLNFAGTVGENKTITVQVNHDAKVEVDEVFQVALGAISGLASGVDVGDIIKTGTPAFGTIVDDDTPGITVSPTNGLITTEAGVKATFNVVLDTKPNADVTIGLSSSDTSEGTVWPTSLTFTLSNWNTEQEVTVTGMDDLADDGDVAYTIVTAPAVSSDTDYSGWNAPDVAVTNQDDDNPPTIASPSSVNAAENQTFVIDVQSADPDGDTEGSGLWYSLTGLVDDALFAINADTGVLTFITAPDFETPGDFGANNVYDVQVTVTDSGGLTDVQDLMVTVTDVNEPPTVSLVNTITTLPEDTSVSNSIRVADIEVSDDALGENNLSLSGTDNDSFQIVGTELHVKAGMLLDFETNPLLDVTVNVDDDTIGATPDNTASLSITVTDVNEPPIARDDRGSGFTTDEDTVFITDNVLSNDSDPDGGPLSVVLFDRTNTSGLLLNNGDGTFIYAPARQFEWLAVGEQTFDTFSYTVSDGNGLTDTATVTITINGVNEAPNLDIPDQEESYNAESLVINDDMIFPASDVDRDPLQYSAEVVVPDSEVVLAYLLDQKYDFRLTGNPDHWFNYRGRNEKYFQGFFILPAGDLYKWGSSIENSYYIATLDSRFYDDPSLLVDVSHPDGFYIDDQILNRAYLLDQQYDFQIPDRAVENNYWENHRGRKERYLSGFFILPAGELYKWGSSIENSYYIATLDSRYYNDPSLLVDIPAPIPSDVTAEFDETTLTITWPAGYLGRFDVAVTVSDGKIPNALSDTFTVTVKNHTPELDPIDPQFVLRGSLKDIPLSARDEDSDELTFSATVERLAPSAEDLIDQLAYDLDQQYDFHLLPGAEAKNFWLNERGANEKYIAGFFILPNSELYRWGGSIAGSTLIATLDNRYYDDPRLLVDATKPASGFQILQAGDTVAWLAYELDQQYDFHLPPGAVANNYWLDYRGRNEKYIAGFFILPNGELYQWGNNTSIATLDNRYYDDPRLLVDVPVPIGEISDSALTLTPLDNIEGDFEVTVTVSDGNSSDSERFVLIVENEALDAVFQDLAFLDG